LGKEYKDVKVIINLPKIEEKDMEIVSRTLVQIANALMVGEESGWISNEKASKVFDYVVSQIGYTIEEKKEKEKVEKKVEEEDLKLKQIYMKKKKAGLIPEEKEEEE